MKKINVAIVGCGAISMIHRAAIHKNDALHLYAVCDIDEEKGRRVALEEQCKYYKDFETILEDEAIDSIHVCTPHYLHAPMICDILKKGKHVLTEKPLGLNEEECEKISILAEKSSAKAGICLQNRFNPTSVALKKMIEEQQYGKVLGMRGIVSWNRDADYYKQSPWRGRWKYEGGGLLMNQMIHTLDLMQWLGGSISHIEGHVANRCLKETIEEEDTAEATLWFTNGAIGSFYGSNTYSTNSSVLLEIHVEQGILRIQDQELIFKNDKGIQCLCKDLSLDIGNHYWGKSHEMVIGQFYAAIIEGHDDYMKIKEGASSVGICQQIYRASGIKQR